MIQFHIIGKNKDIDLNSRVECFNLTPKIEGLLGLPEIRTSSGTNAGVDGGWTSEQYYEPRLLNLTGNIVSFDRQEVAQKRRELGALLAEKSLRIKYVSEIGETFYADVVVIGFTSELGNDGRVFQYKLQLRQDDPLFYQLGENGELVATLSVQKQSSGFEIPFRFNLEIGGGGAPQTVENTGGSTVYPVITIKGVSTNPEIINKTTKESIKVYTTTSANDTLEINCKLKTITLNGADVYYLKSDASVFFGLVSGVNEMVFVSENQNDKGKAEISYASGFIEI